MINLNKTGTAAFKGKGVVRYDPRMVSYRTVLSQMLEGALIPDYDPVVPGTALFTGTAPKINNINLVNPALINDKRWETIHLTTSNLFLGSALSNAGYLVRAGKLLLPTDEAAEWLTSAHMIGLTLFEDLFLPIQAFLERLGNDPGFTGLIAAGGPLITLNLLETSFHMPQINLLVRGEGETVFPALLEAVNADDLHGLLTLDGFLFQVPGLLVFSNLETVNRPLLPENFRFNLNFIAPEQMKEGLEINLSRGCKRSCIFCSAVQGKLLRKLPVARLDELLQAFDAKLRNAEPTTPHARTVNINDDDILQDPIYAAEVFQSIKRNNFRLWGIQTSINSFFKSPQEIDQNLLELVADKSLYMGDKPLVWLGTDAFLSERSKKLAKLIPAEDQLFALVELFQQKDVRNYHYWISSDHASDWSQVCREFILIYRLKARFDSFGLLAHAPFLVPYTSTPLFRLLSASEEKMNRVRIKKHLESPGGGFDMLLVERVETPFLYLNRLLDNEKLPGRLGFFDYLGRKDFLEALITMYNFLKQERMDAQTYQHSQSADTLLETETLLEEFIGSVL